MDSEIQCPIALKWTISHQKLLENLDKTLQSSAANAVGLSSVSYKLEICPNGQGTETDKRKVWIGLSLNIGAEKIIESNFIIKVETAEFQKSFAHTFSQPQATDASFGGIMCFHFELFDPNFKFIVFDELIVKVEGVLTVKRQIGVKKLKLQSLSNYLWESDDKDFTISVDGQDFKVHKFVLSARSKYFQRLLSNDSWKETSEEKIEIKGGVSEETVEIAVRFFYDQDISSSELLTLPNAMAVLEFSNMHLIEDLKDSVEDFLIESMNTSNVCELANFSLKANAAKLEKRCFIFLTTCLKSVHPISTNSIKISQ